MRRWSVCLVVAILAAGCDGGALVIRSPALLRPIRLQTLNDKRAAFAQALESFRRGQLDAASPIFEGLIEAYPELVDYHLYFAGVIHQRTGHTEAATTAFGRIWRAYPQSLMAPAAALELGNFRLQAGEIDTARPWLEIATAAPEAAVAQAARLALAELSERAGDVTAASAGYMAVRHDALGTAPARAAKERVLALRQQYPALVPVGRDRLDDARLLLAEHDYAAAEAAAAHLVEHPAGVEPADAMRVHADALYGHGKIEPALTALWDLAHHYPTSMAAPPALFRMATILWNRDRDTAALRVFEEFGQRYPRHSKAAEALYAVGRIHQQAGRTAAAIKTFGDLARRYPRSELVAEAQWRIGWIRYVSGEPSAAATFSALRKRTRDRARDEATYWEARALERSGRSFAARALYRDILDRDPSGYYAMWAQQRLGLAVPPSATAAVGAPLPPVAPELPGAATQADGFHLRRWEELRAAGVNGLARSELAAIERDHRSDSAMLDYLLRAYQTVDGYAAALRVLRRLNSNGRLSAAERERLMYPLAFWSTVRREADTQGLDPLLVEAIMRQESRFDPEARSSADARGLMQLLPVTAEKVAPAAGAHVDPTDLTEPDTNIQLGVRYLRSLYDRFQGDILKVVAAYNGGEAAVEKWQRRVRDLEADEFVESISFRETRDYVKRVVANYRKYQALYVGP